MYLVTSDAHLGIQHAIGEVLPNASWQRCCTHFTKNLSGMVSKTQWPTLSSMFHTIFRQPDADAVWAQAREVVAFCEQKFPHVADYLEEALDELLAFTQAPKAVWTKVWSNNPTSAAEPGNPPAHRRRRDLPQPGRSPPPRRGCPSRAA